MSVVRNTSPDNSGLNHRFKIQHYENYKLARRYFLTCCRDMKNLQATYATTPANGDAIPYDWDAFSMVETKQLDGYWTPAENAFLQDWQGLILWAHPPYSLAGQVLLHHLRSPSPTTIYVSNNKLDKKY